MAIHIKNKETGRLIRELAQATSEDLTEAVTVAVRERLARVKSASPRRNVEGIEAIIADAAKRFRTPHDTIDHGDLLYDEEPGLPT